jgi:hypothetical protein
MQIVSYQFSLYEITRLVYETKQIQRAVAEWRERV